MVMDLFTERADVNSGTIRARQQLRRCKRRLLGIVFRTDAMPAALLPDMLAQKLVGSGIENADVKGIPLNIDELPDPARRNAVIGCIDFDTPIQMNGAFSVLVVTKRLQRQWNEERLLLSKHCCDLPLRGS